MTVRVCVSSGYQAESLFSVGFHSHQKEIVSCRIASDQVAFRSLDSGVRKLNSSVSMIILTWE